MKQVILFKGSDCVPCTQFEPVFDDLTSYCNNAGTDFIFSKEVDNIELMRKYGLRSVPAVVVITDKGSEVFMGKNLKGKVLLSYLAQER